MRWAVAIDSEREVPNSQNSPIGRTLMMMTTMPVLIKLSIEAVNRVIDKKVEPRKLSHNSKKAVQMITQAELVVFSAYLEPVVVNPSQHKTTPRTNLLKSKIRPTIKMIETKSLLR